jgi:succinate dehydrogenase/fumarate reductase-like Fe-S protein
MHLTLRVWRQKNPQDLGRFVDYEARDVNEHMSFLEMLDVVDEGLVKVRERSRQRSCGSSSARQTDVATWVATRPDAISQPPRG